MMLALQASRRASAGGDDLVGSEPGGTETVTQGGVVDGDHHRGRVTPVQRQPFRVERFEQ